MRRRDFVGLIAGPLAWPLGARAQAGDSAKVIGWLNVLPENDREAQRRIEVFRQSLAELGWIEGRSVRIEARWAAGDDDKVGKYSVELAALAPDVILTSSSVTVRPLQQATRTIPIVF